jgi:hypothetical protein
MNTFFHFQKHDKNWVRWNKSKAREL